MCKKQEGLGLNLNLRLRNAVNVSLPYFAFYKGHHS